MPRNATTGVFTRVNNSFSEPVAGTLIDPVDAIALFDDQDTGLNWVDGSFATMVTGTRTAAPSGVTSVITQNTAPLRSMLGFTGTNDPQLVVGGADGKRGFIAVQSYQNGSPGTESSFLAFTANGTALAPTATVSGDFLGEFGAHGWNNTTTPGFVFSAGAFMIIRATDNYTLSAAGAAVDFYSTPTGSAVAQLIGSFDSTNFKGLTVGGTTLAAAGTARFLTLNGGASGTGAGTALFFSDVTHSAIGAIGNTSAVLGSAYSQDLMIYSASANIVFYPGGLTEHMRFGADGGFGVGVTTAAGLGSIAGSGALQAAPPTTKTANYTQLVTDHSLIFNGAGTLTFTPLAAATYPGRQVVVKTIAAQAVISNASNVVPQAGGAAGTAILAATAGKWAMLISDGTNWQIMASN